MIISDKYRYVFVEFPHTATTAISAELIEQYSGRKILTKHATYRQFRRVASDEQLQYMVFSGLRHPMDEAVTLYSKYRTDHLGAYSKDAKARRATITRRDLKRFSQITDHGLAFHEYFRKCYRWPYDNWSCLDHSRFDMIIHFESLQEDFARMLSAIGAKQVRPLPILNKTSREERPYESFYSAEVRDHAAYVFGPYMEKWNYSFPATWGKVRIPWRGRLLFHLLRPLRRYYWGYVRWNSNAVGRIFRRLLLDAGKKNSGGGSEQIAARSSRE